MKKYRKKILIILAFLLIVIVLKIFNIQAYFKVDFINENLKLIKNYVNENFVFSSFMYIILYSLIVALTLPFATIISLLGGLVWGVKYGVVLVVTGATIGASANFLLTRYLFGESIQKKYSGKLKKINREIEINGKNYLLTLRLIPIFPFFLINIASGLSNIRYITFLWTTFFGIIPGTFAYVYFGSSLNYISKNTSSLPLPVVFGLVFIGFMTIVPVLYKKFIKSENR
ncbi:TVP38/TMEM64 family protein [Helicovermis profundi]|uniref:TVP38/TMEM64 family membrane protein n=1 Tax=Helicovermis profundi TaxID=3065157 RepID=A0AAU9E2J2_9FIRM|nr:TVP38/TMEM64 family protein [Clostridia bacterium S502]